MSSNLVIVALPADDDPIWKVSSEKKPHLTICFLGDVDTNPHVDRIMLFVEHAVQIAARGPFYLEVDHRDVLGPDKADVLMFRKDWSFRWLNRFRNQLLQNNDIKVAYESVEQYPEYQPHLTLGYPPTPAHEDKVPEYGMSMVRFDRIGVWTGDYEGPDWRLEWPEQQTLDEAAWGVDLDLERQASGIYTLQHHGVKGMRWGQRKEDVASGAKSVAKGAGKAAKGLAKFGDDVLFETGTRSDFIRQEIASTAHDNMKAHDLPSIKAKHPVGGKFGNRLKKPLSPEAKAYRKDVKSAYLKQLEAAANEHTNIQGNRRYTLKEHGQPNTSQYFWEISTEAAPARHAASVPFRVRPIFDEDGYIVDFEYVPNELAQNAFVDDYLAHYGVKGMRWGRRSVKDTAVTVNGKAKMVTAKKATKLDKSWEKNQFTLPKGIERHNAMAVHFNQRIGAINDKYHDHDFSKEAFDHPAAWSPKYKQYMNEVGKQEEASFRHAVTEVHGTSPTGKKKMTVEYTPDGDLRMVVKNVDAAHAAVDPGNEVFLFKVTRNSNGLITSVEPTDSLTEGSMAQADLVAEILTHHGIKGMRWGFRKSTPAAVVPSGTSRVPHGTKRKTKVDVQGGENHPAHQDAIKVAESRAKLAKSGAAALSNQELRDVANRLQLENQVSLLTSSKGKQFVSKQFETQTQQLAREGVRRGLKTGGKHVVKKVARTAAVAGTTAALI